MKCLIVGNADSIYIKQLIEKTILPYHDEVTILSPSNKNYKEYYHNKRINVIRECVTSKRMNIILSGLLNRHAFMKTEKYDLVSFHYITNRTLFMIPIAKHYSKKVIVSYWGSDLLRNSNRRCLTKWFYRDVDLITMTTSSLIRKFRKTYGAGFDNKIRLIDFGSANMEMISEKSKVKSDYHDKYGIDKRKVIISIGYNSNREHQHLNVLEQICRLPEEQRTKIHLLLRLTYGSGDDHYIERIQKMVNDTGCSSTLFTTYLSDEMIAEITLITDIFINAQITDAQSATVCEHLYSRCVVFNPSWIQYDVLKKNSFYLEYNCFEDLYQLLSNNIVKKENSQYRSYLEDNERRLYKICSWNSYIPRWRNAYIINS